MVEGDAAVIDQLGDRFEAAVGEQRGAMAELVAEQRRAMADQWRALLAFMLAVIALVVIVGAAIMAMVAFPDHQSSILGAAGVAAAFVPSP